jgi:O-antigen/teichoic acid export membrane protein
MSVERLVLPHHVSSSRVSDHLRGAESGDRLGRSALREASLTGVRWSSSTRLVAEALSFAASVVLAHLITPAEFGLAAIALGIALIAPSVIGASFGVPLVQMRVVDRAHLEAATVLSIATGVGLTLTTIFVISPIAIEPIFGSRVAYLLQLASLTFALAGVGAVPNALLQRALRFRRLSEIEIASIVTGPTTSISLAAMTSLSAEAIVLGGVATAAVGTLLTVTSAPRLGFGWHRAPARAVAGVGVFAALTALVNALSTSVHYMILGARLPARDVGLFWRAYQLAVGYQTKVGSITMRIAFPLFSRSGTLDEMRHLRGRILQMQSIVIFPLLAMLILLAPEVVPLLFGTAWEDAVFPTQVLAVAGAATIAASAGDPLAFAAGKGRRLFYFNLVRLVGFAAVVLWSSNYGIGAVAVAIAVYQVLLVAAQFVYLESRGVGIPLRETWGALVPATVASTASLVVAYPTVRQLLPDVGDAALVVGGGAFLVALYALVLRVVFPSSWFAVVRNLAAVARPGAGRAAEGPAAPADGLAEVPETARK